MTIQTKSTSMNVARNISKQIKIENAKPTKDILVDFVIVYLFVPLWITLLASTLKYSREKYIWTQWVLGDLIVMFMPFAFVAIPLNYLRLQASNPSHFLHQFRVETKEIFMEETRAQPAPSMLSWDAVIFSVMIISYNLWNPFQDDHLSQIPFLTLYSQSFVVLAVWDAGIYWEHRISHQPKWYKYHKKHHEVRNSIAFRAHHIEGLEVLMNALILYVVPMMYQICGMAMVHEVWITGGAFMLAQAYIYHSDLYFVSSRWSLGLICGDLTICHSNHHSKNDGNFGIVAPLIWDWICDTRYKPSVKHS